MNTYDVALSEPTEHDGVAILHRYEVDALKPNIAIEKALRQLPDVEISNVECIRQLTGVNLQPHHLHVRRPSF